MKPVILLIISTLNIYLSYAQINEIGVFFGGSNFIGDVGATDYIAPNQLTFGGLYKWNRSKRHSYRASLLFSELKGTDIEASDPRRLERGYAFSNSILEAAVGVEFTFMDFDLHSGEKLWTPYLFSGLSVAKHDNYYFLNDIQTTENNSSWAYGIPIVLGIKTNFLDPLIASIEVGARHTFSDELDGSMPDGDFRASYQFGNVNNNDWYVFSGITLTYTFGQNPCYCIK